MRTSTALAYEHCYFLLDQTRLGETKKASISLKECAFLLRTEDYFSKLHWRHRGSSRGSDSRG